MGVSNQTMVQLINAIQQLSNNSSSNSGGTAILQTGTANMQLGPVTSGGVVAVEYQILLQTFVILSITATVLATVSGTNVNLQLSGLPAAAIPINNQVVLVDANFLTNNSAAANITAASIAAGNSTIAFGGGFNGVCGVAAGRNLMWSIR